MYLLLNQNMKRKSAPEENPEIEISHESAIGIFEIPVKTNSHVEISWKEEV